jgi:cytochrome b6-f complex iron-sulfur subunit
VITQLVGAVLVGSVVALVVSWRRRWRADRLVAVGALAVPAPAPERVLVGAGAPVTDDVRSASSPRPAVDDGGFTRRQFFNRSLGATLVLAASGLGTGALAFLWPTLSGGFGSKVRVGRLDELLATVRTTRQPVYVPEGRTYLVPFPPESLPAARQVYRGDVLEGMEAGIVAMYQKCVHLGCRVPWCASSQWFECPCHQSKYNRVGEHRDGPAPRGLDRFGVTVAADGVVTVDTSVVHLGPAVGTDTTGQGAEGPHCV